MHTGLPNGLIFRAYSLLRIRLEFNSDIKNVIWPNILFVCRRVIVTYKLSITSAIFVFIWKGFYGHSIVDFISPFSRVF